MWASAKPGKSPEALWKAAEPLVSFGKTQQKPQGTLERSGEPCKLWQRPAKALGHSGEEESPLCASTKPSKVPGALWKSAGPLVGFGKGQQKPWESLEGSKGCFWTLVNPG